jgi:putative transcriptional regulator
MRTRDFDQLVASIKEAGAIRRREIQPGRMTVFEPTDVKAVRAKLKLTQADFALMIGVSVATLRNWEQGRRQPEGPAKALLRVTAHSPEVVAQALRVAS